MTLIIRQGGLSAGEHDSFVLVPDLPRNQAYLKCITRPYVYETSFILRGQTPFNRNHDNPRRTSRYAPAEFHFPAPLPSSGIEIWRIGLVQNVLARKEIATWGNQSHTTTDLGNTNILDSDASDNYRPFYADPFAPDTGTGNRPTTARPRSSLRLARATGGDPLAPLPPPRPSEARLWAGADFCVAPNGTLAREHRNIEFESLPPQPESQRFPLRIGDKPYTKTPLYCDGTLLREVQLMQVQQFYLVIKRANDPFRILLMSSPFTTYCRANIRPPVRSRDFSDSQQQEFSPVVSASYNDFVPWNANLEDFPRRQSDRWKTRPWQQMLQRLPPELRRTQNNEAIEKAPLISTKDNFDQWGFPTEMALDGTTANELINAPNPNLPECLQSFNQHIRQS